MTTLFGSRSALGGHGVPRISLLHSREAPPVTELDDSLLELAQAYGIATEYWDWQGRHVSVDADTVIAVLAGLEIDAGTPEQAWHALHEHHREPWTRMLPPCVATREGQPYEIWVHVTDGDPVDIWIELETGGGRGLRQLENWNPPREIDGRWVGEASFEIPGDLPLGYHTVRARSACGGGGDAVDHHPGLARPPGPARRASRLGSGHPALQRPQPRLVGRRRPDRPDRSGRLVRCRARRGLHPDQPAARRRAGAADGAVAVPAEHPPVLQPALHPTRADPRVRRPRRRSAGRGRGPAGRPRHAAGLAEHRPRRRLDRQAGGAQDHLRSSAIAGPTAGVHGLPPARRRRPAPLRPVVGAE